MEAVGASTAFSVLETVANILQLTTFERQTFGQHHANVHRADIHRTPDKPERQ
jgi:hypothetical protein